jgi:hypothetical protein
VKAHSPIAWWGDPDLKETVIARLKEHRAYDEFVQGFYQVVRDSDCDCSASELTKYACDHITAVKDLRYGLTREDTYLGCAVGCTLPPVTPEQQNDPANWDKEQMFSWHVLLQNTYGIDAKVAYLIDSTFEAQSTLEAAGDFAVAAIQAIPVGADLSGVWSIPHTCGGTVSDSINRDQLDHCVAHALLGFGGDPVTRAKTLIGLLSDAPVPE